MNLLKQSTSRNISFLMVDSTDSITGKTGLSPSVTLSKDGGGFGAAGGSVSEVGNGWYSLAANTTDTGTLGDLILHATATGADVCDMKLQVVVDLPGATITSVSGAVGSVTGNVGGNVVGSVASVTGAVGSVTGNVGGNVVGSVASVVGAVGSVSGAVGSVTGAVGSVTGNVGGNVVGSVASVTGAVGSVTGNVGGNVVGSVASVTNAVTISAGTGAGQLDFTNGVVKANLAQILGTALTETAGQIAAGFKKFFNISSPTSTMNEITLVDTVTTYTGNTPQTGDAYARLGAPAGVSVSADIALVKTDVLLVPTNPLLTTDTRLNHLDADVSSRLATSGYTTPPTTSQITNAVWDETTSGHTTSGSFGVLTKSLLTLAQFIGLK